MDDDRLAAIKARLEGITPGEWWQYEGDFMSVGCTSPEHGELMISEDIYTTTDAAFIAAAPKDIRYLVGEVERLRDMLQTAMMMATQNNALLERK